MRYMLLTVISSVILATMAKINYKLCLFQKHKSEVYILQLQSRLTRNLVIYVVLWKLKNNFRVHFHNIAIDITVRG